MKKKGRYVLEAAFLTPWVCILLVYIVFFTFYAHDYAVCVHTMMQTGVKGIYRNSLSDSQIEKNIEEDLEQKLMERLLWVKEIKVEVHVNPIRASIQVCGSGSLLSVGEIKIQNNIYRNTPCETVRRSKWLKN